jgi:alpha-tubulin suppressor-like RCC1 family protein
VAAHDSILKRLTKWPFRHFSKPVLVLIAVMFVLAVGLAMFNQREISPPVTIIRIGQSHAPVKVFPTYGASIFVLPDGSLWRWGAAWPGPGLTPIPEQVGTDRDWVEAAACGNHYLGLRRNGTLWEWGWANNQYTNVPIQVDSSTNWIAVSASGVHAMALRKDGTLWGWGKNSLSQLGTRTGPEVIYPVQVATNTRWTAIACHVTGTHALAADGTIWTWGSIPISSQGTTRPFAVPFPTRISSESNWIGFASGFTSLFRLRNGEIWAPFISIPSANTSLKSTCTLVVSNSLLNGIAAAVTDSPRLFQLHADGTLWQKPYPVPSGFSSSEEVWKQVGKRKNWVSLWSANGTAFGLTSDGIIWTWGYDPSRPPKHSLSSWFKTMQTTLRSRLAKTPVTMTRPPRAYQKEPRPLIRLVLTKDVSAAQAPSSTISFPNEK